MLMDLSEISSLQTVTRSSLLVFSGCLDPNTPAVCSGFGLRSCRGGRIHDKSSTFLSDNPPLADWTPSMCNNIPAGRPLLGGGSVLVILVMMVAAWGGEEEGGSIRPSIQISINQDGSLYSSSHQIRQMITSIQPTRAVDGPSCAAIRPPRASWRSGRRISVFLFFTNRLIKTMMIDTQKINELCVSGGRGGKHHKPEAESIRVSSASSAPNQAPLQQR